MRILFITSGRIGDAVLSTGLLDMLLARYPQARFTVACGPDPAPLFAEMPALERLLVMEKRPWLGHWYELWRQVVLTPWSLLVDLRGSAIGQVLIARRRKVLRRSMTRAHKVRQLGLQFGMVDPPAPRIWLSRRQEQMAETLLPPGAPILALGVGARWEPKRWPPERFAELARRLVAHGGILPAARIVLLGGPEDAGQASQVLQGLTGLDTVDLVGRTDLLTAQACLRRAALFVGNDSGLMHMAAAADVPTLGLFGPSREAVYAPWGEKCASVRGPASYEELALRPEFRTGRGSLMADLPVTTVVRAAEELWRREGGGMA
ncbi:MAG: glycosyltransferase family 9 protein [Alphaproteobacteria bacterium]|nr:glycosyltransferase family 9 protein [Alphaproteobacteria bacterium]